ncbi:MAG: ATP-binding protein [Deltaproteobacteria bacterium]|nr:ATP-binding protein [Deltaproteobacteria bacterium]
MNSRKMQLQVKSDRVIELFARDIYQSPLSLLRENVQNAFDAILMRRRGDDSFSPRIDVRIGTNTVTVSDNGNGMTADELEANYWYAGNSGKNTEEARKAGVVGTFGIGAMANFGVAERLEVETESSATGERSRSSVAKENLSINQECIDLVPLPSTGEPGTTVTAFLPADGQFDLDEARRYISDFVSLLKVPVYVNGNQESGHRDEEIVPLPPVSWRGQSYETAGRLGAHVDLAVAQNGDVWVRLDRMTWSDQEMHGSMTLRSDTPGLRTYRNGFGLATVGAATAYQFGGVVDLMELYPTAGREALTSTSMQLIQSMLADVDEIVSRLLSGRPECDSSSAFMRWVVSNSRYELCELLRIGTDTDERLELGVIRADTERHYRSYAGTDRGLVDQLSSDESPLLLIARYDPRRRCEREYIERFCSGHISEISDEPQVTEVLPGSEYSRSEYAILFRIQSILEKDYLLSSEVRFGHISHRIPVFAEKHDGSVVVTIERDLSAIEVIVGLYENEYSAFGAMVIDFVRGVIFQRISRYVPNSQTQGTQAFLQMIRRRREAIEYERDDIQEFPDLTFWDDVRNDRVAVAEAIKRAMAISRNDVQVLDFASAASMGDVLPDVAANQEALKSDTQDEMLSLEALPAIIRSDVSCSAKLLTIPLAEPALTGYRCFLALGHKAKEDKAEFFLQPHTTSIVWGGQRVLFIFAHRSEEYGLYYDLESRTLISDEPGGGRFPTCTIFVANQVYIPIPPDIQSCFLPQEGERKRFLVRDDLLSVGSGVGY